MAKEEQMMMSMIILVIGMSVITQVLGGVTPTPSEPTPPEPTPGGFPCPYGPLIFDTMQELSDHIAEAHPDRPQIILIDIGWD